MTSGIFLTGFEGEDGLWRLRKKGVLHLSGTIFHLVKSDFWSVELFPVKTGSCPTEMVDPSFDVKYPALPGLVEVSDP